MSLSVSGTVLTVSKDAPFMGQTSMMLQLGQPINGSGSMVLPGDQTAVKVGSSLTITIIDPAPNPNKGGA